MRRLSIVSVLVLWSLVTCVTAQEAAELRIESTPLGGGVYLLASGAGGNLALLAGEGGTLLVDAEYQQLHEQVRAAIGRITDRPVRYLVNTHWHFDHVGGNEGFAREGSLVIAHENVRRLMADDQVIAILDHEVPASPAGALPTVTFHDRLTLHLGDEEVVVHHLPHAHTGGDGVVQFRRANVIHTGDIFFNCGYPFIDVSGGGTIDGLITAVEAILRLCDGETKIIPGHGSLAGKAELTTYLGLLREFREIVAGQAAAGKNLDEIKAAKVTATLDEVWGQVYFTPDQFTEMVYRTLGRR